MKNYMLNKIISWIVGGDLFEKIKEIVLGLFDADMPGNEKRERALKQLQEIGASAAEFLLNLGIEAAVYLVKQEQGKLK